MFPKPPRSKGASEEDKVSSGSEYARLPETWFCCLVGGGKMMLLNFFLRGGKKNVDNVSVKARTVSRKTNEGIKQLPKCF